MLRKSRRYVSSILIFAIIMLFALTSCTTTTKEPEEESVNENVELTENENAEVPEGIVVDHQTYDDTTEPMEELLATIYDTDDAAKGKKAVGEEPAVLEEHVTISTMLYENIMNKELSNPRFSYDLADGNVLLVFSELLKTPAEVMFVKFDPKTGKLLETAKISNLYGEFSYAEQNYNKDLDCDFYVLTTRGIFLFKAEEFSTEPKSIMLEDGFYDDIEELKIHSLKDNNDFGLNHEQVGISPHGDKVVYTTKEGVFLTDLSGKNPEKIADNINKEVLVEKSKEITINGEKVESTISSEYIDNKYIYNTKLNGLLVKPRFSQDGKSVVLEIRNYDIPGDFAGMAVINLETKEIKIIKYYDPESEFALGHEVEWATQENSSAKMVKIISENEVVMTSTATFDGSIYRYDAIYNFLEGKITNTYISKTGLTKDYEVIVVNDSFKGANDRIQFYDLRKSGMIIRPDIDNMDEALLKGCTYRAISISENYCVVQFSSTEGVTDSDGKEIFKSSMAIVPVAQRQ